MTPPGTSPIRYRRVQEGGGGTKWLVLDANGREVGQVFKYIGYWWADNAGSMSNRYRTKDDAARAVLNNV